MRRYLLAIFMIFISVDLSCSTKCQNVDTTMLFVDTLSSSEPVAKTRIGLFKRLYNYFASSNKDNTLNKKFDFTIIGGPHFSSDVGLGLGVVASGLFRVDRDDLSIPPSNVSLFGDIATSGFYLLGVRGNTLFSSAKYRIDYTLYVFSFPSYYWGIGYEDATYIEATKYTRLQNQIKIDLMMRLFRNGYLGTNINFNYVEGKKFTDISYLCGQKSGYVNGGLGLFLQYDSRDFIPNPYRGVYLRLDNRYFPSFLGTSASFNRLELFFDTYHSLWKGATFATDLHSIFTQGDTPWTMLAMVGGSYRMRGYYEGRYRDKNLVEVQLELRQKIWRRNGIAVWCGAGNVFSSFKNFNFAHTLPNYGVGYRWEFKNRVNVRLDYGFGKAGQSSFIFNIDEAF